MRFKSVFILSVFVLGIFSLFLCKPEPALAQQTEKEIIKRTVFCCELIQELEPEKIVEHKRNLARVLVKVRDRLIEFYNKGTDESFEAMGNLFALRGAVIEDISPSYTRVSGDGAIAGFFAKLRTKTPERALEIEIRHVFIDKIFDEKVVKIEDKEETVNWIARIIFRWRLPEKGESMKNLSGGGSFECLHRQHCTWYCEE